MPHFALDTLRELCEVGTRESIMKAYNLRDMFHCRCEKCVPIVEEMNRCLEEADAKLLEST